MCLYDQGLLYTVKLGYECVCVQDLLDAARLRFMRAYVIMIYMYIYIYAYCTGYMCILAEANVVKRRCSNFKKDLVKENTYMYTYIHTYTHTYIHTHT